MCYYIWSRNIQVVLDHLHRRSNWSHTMFVFHTALMLDFFSRSLSLWVEFDDLNERRFIVANIKFFFSHREVPGRRLPPWIFDFIFSKEKFNNVSIYKVIYSILKSVNMKCQRPNRPHKINVNLTDLLKNPTSINRLSLMIHLDDLDLVD